MRIAAKKPFTQGLSVCVQGVTLDLTQVNVVFSSSIPLHCFMFLETNNLFNKETQSTRIPGLPPTAPAPTQLNSNRLAQKCHCPSSGNPDACRGAGPA